MFSVHNATSIDFTDILALQHRNHRSNLDPDARDDGFLTTQLTSEKMTTLCARHGIVVVRAASGKLAGFGCGENWDLSGERAFHRAVLALFPLPLGDFFISAQNSFQYGPVCVAAASRGQGVLKLLIAAVSDNFRAHCDCGVTFIDHRNARCLAAHERKLGFQVVAELPYDDTIYHVLGFSISSFL